MLLAGSLSFWLGVPAESHNTTDLFQLLQLSEVDLVQKDSLQYGNLFFCKIQVEADSLPNFLAQLDTMQMTRGSAEKPIALELERPWWDPPPNTPGLYWRKKAVTIWSPKDYPDIFYAVTKVNGEGEEPSTANRP